MARLALYGNVGIPRVYCQDCQRNALVIKGIKQCCDQKDADEVKGVERIIEPEGHRKHGPPKAEQEALLTAQGYRCLYCDKRLGSTAWYKGKRVVLKLHWDHVIPYEYGQNNDVSNFVAACHVCNHWKSDFVFNSLEEIQVYVGEKWQRAETNVGKNLPGMRYDILE